MCVCVCIGEGNKKRKKRNRSPPSGYLLRRSAPYRCSSGISLRESDLADETEMLVQRWKEDAPPFHLLRSPVIGTRACNFHKFLYNSYTLCLHAIPLKIFLIFPLFFRILILVQFCILCLDNRLRFFVENFPNFSNRNFQHYSSESWCSCFDYLLYFSEKIGEKIASLFVRNEFEMNERKGKNLRRFSLVEFNWNAFPTMGKEWRGGRAIRSDGIEDSSSFMMDQSRSDDNGNNGRGTRRNATELIDRNWSIILFRDFNLIEPWGMFAQCILKVSI